MTKCGDRDEIKWGVPPRIGVALWTVGDQGPTSFEAAATVGLDYVEIDMGGEGRGPDLTEIAAVTAVVAASKQFHLPVTAIAINRANDLGLHAPDGSAEARALEQVVEASMVVAERLCAPRIIIPGFRRSCIRSPLEAKRTALRLRQIFDRLQSAGLALSWESESNAAVTLHVIRLADRSISLQFDTGNPALAGCEAATMWLKLADFAVSQVHVKDVPTSLDRTDIALGNGIADLAGVFSAFAKIGRPAAFTLEGNYRNMSCARLRRDLGRLKGLLVQLYPDAAS